MCSLARFGSDATAALSCRSASRGCPRRRSSADSASTISTCPGESSDARSSARAAACASLGSSCAPDAVSRASAASRSTGYRASGASPIARPRCSIAASRSCGPPRRGSCRAHRSARSTLSSESHSSSRSPPSAPISPPSFDQSCSIAPTSDAPVWLASSDASTRARVCPSRGSNASSWIVPGPFTGGSIAPVTTTCTSDGASPRLARSFHAAGGTNASTGEGLASSGSSFLRACSCAMAIPSPSTRLNACTSAARPIPRPRPSSGTPNGMTTVWGCGIESGP